MMDAEKDLEYMEAYLDGTLDSSERKAFEDRLNSDPAFAEEYHLFKISHHGIVIQSRAETKTYLGALDGKSKSGNTRWLYVSLAIAAGVLLLIAVTYLISSSVSTRDLYDKYYQSYPNVVAAIERNESPEDPWRKSFQLYEKADYRGAMQMFKDLLKDKPESPELNLYAGLSSLELNEPESAINYFKKVIANKPNDFYTQAMWYSALASIKMEDRKEAEIYLKALSGHHNYYKAKADSLLKDLD